MQAIIIAGGKGTRLRPLTYGCPKPLLPLVDRPFLQWLIERCVAAGITDILVNVHYQAHQVQNFLGSGEKWGARIRYIEESQPLDTAGAITLARSMLTGEPLVVFNADILTDLDLPALISWHIRHQAQVTLALSRVEDITPFGLVELNDRQEVIAFREKPTADQAALFLAKGINTINGGTYVIDPTLFDPYAAGEPLSFERVFFPGVLSQGHSMIGFVWEGYWLDVGTPLKYYQAQLDILQQRLPFPLDAHSPRTGVWIGQEVILDAAAQLESPCYIGTRSVVGKQARIPAGTLLGPNSLIDAPIVAGIYPEGTIILSP